MAESKWLVLAYYVIFEILDDIDRFLGRKWAKDFLQNSRWLLQSII